MSEDSILQLIKDLANVFGGTKTTNYLGVYEGLLTKKPQKGWGICVNYLIIFQTHMYYIMYCTNIQLLIFNFLNLQIWTTIMSCPCASATLVEIRAEQRGS